MTPAEALALSLSASEAMANADNAARCAEESIRFRTASRDSQLAIAKQAALTAASLGVEASDAWATIGDSLAMHGIVVLENDDTGAIVAGSPEANLAAGGVVAQLGYAVSDKRTRTYLSANSMGKLGLADAKSVAPEWRENMSDEQIDQLWRGGK
jgi:hypothetical protein